MFGNLCNVLLFVSKIIHINFILSIIFKKQQILDKDSYSHFRGID